MAGSRTGGRAHFATAEQESARYRAAERLGELIERREELLTRSGEAAAAAELVGIEAQMKAAKAKIKAFD